MTAKDSGRAMTAFERRRLENKAANDAMLKDIEKTASRVIPAAKPPPIQSATRKRTRAEPVRREPTRPTRMSSRLAGLEVHSEVLKRKLEVEAEAQAEEARE